MAAQDVNRTFAANQKHSRILASDGPVSKSMVHYIAKHVFHLDEATTQKIIGVTKLQRRFRSVLDDVVRQRVPYVLTRGSRPEAALIPYEEFLRFQALQEQEVMTRFGRLLARMAEWNAAASEDKVAADVAAALAEPDDWMQMLDFEKQ